MSKAKDLLGKTGSAGIQTEPNKSAIPMADPSELKEAKHPEFEHAKDAKPAKGSSSHAAGGGGGAGAIRPKV